jgi:hypothetical protein
MSCNRGELRWSDGVLSRSIGTPCVVFFIGVKVVVLNNGQGKMAPLCAMGQRRGLCVQYFENSTSGFPLSDSMASR